MIDLVYEYILAANQIQQTQMQDLTDMISNNEYLDPKNKYNGELQQSVKIEANFPNVTNRTEIEEAFTRLITIASQKASSY